MLDFLAYLEFERGLSRNTLEAYRSDLLQFGRFLDARGVDALDAGPRATSADFLAALAAAAPSGKPASPATIHRKAACLRSFYRHLRREGVRESDPTAGADAPRRGRKLPAGAHPRRGRASCSPSRAAPSPAALRDRALLELMYACGLRASEAIGLELGDVDLEERRAAGARQGLEGAASCRSGSAALGALGIYLERGRPDARQGARPRRTCS